MTSCPELRELLGALARYNPNHGPLLWTLLIRNNYLPGQPVADDCGLYTLRQLGATLGCSGLLFWPAWLSR